MATAANAPNSTESDIPLPQRLGRFVLLKLIARGGMGEVFLAATGDIEGAERPVVVKVIRREHAKDASFMARFLDEARVQAQLQHPGVAQVIEASTDGDGQPYVAVEYVEGRSLAEARARAIQLGVKIGWAEAVAVCASVAEALAHVHERVDVAGKPLNIAHRDLSPQNVMVGFSGEAKLIDFGTARGANRRSRTVAGVVYAKPGYVAPEVANGIAGDALVDVYALGVMLWELCAGRRFLQGDASEHMAAVAQNRRSLSAIAAVAGAPAELDAVLARMTAHDKTRRLTAREACGELIKLLSSSAPLPSGERGVRARVSSMLAALYPAEPKRSRGEFHRLLAQAKKMLPEEIKGKKPESQPTPGQARVQQELAEGMLPGTRYRVVRKLGEGAGGVVYEGVHIDLQRRVALKVLTPERAARAADASRFKREAWALSKVAHRNSVKLYDFGVSTDGRMYFAMEYLEGETLEHMLEREKALGVGEALRIAHETALALEVAHAAGLVHRDIKPENLFLTSDGGVKVLDFGVVCAPGDGTGQGEGVTPSLALFGTPEYMAPEQIDGSPIDGRADIYALGSVLYEMLTGRLPFASSSNVSLLDLKRKTDPEPPSERAPARRLSREIDAVVMRAMGRRPFERYADATELRQAIEKLQSNHLRGSPRRRALGFAAVAAAMVSALALLGAGSSRLSPQSASVQTVLARVDPLLRAITGSRVTTPVSPAPVAAPPPAVVASASPEPAPAAPPAPAALASAAAQPPTVDVNQLAAVETREPDAPKMAPAELQALQSKARKAAAKRRWKATRKLAEEWVKVDPSSEARMTLGRSLFHLGLEAEAGELVEKVVKEEPDNKDAQQLLEEIKKRVKQTGRGKGGKMMTAKK